MIEVMSDAELLPRIHGYEGYLDNRDEWKGLRLLPENGGPRILGHGWKCPSFDQHNHEAGMTRSLFELLNYWNGMNPERLRPATIEELLMVHVVCKPLGTYARFAEGGHWCWPAESFRRNLTPSDRVHAVDLFSGEIKKFSPVECLFHRFVYPWPPSAGVENRGNPGHA